MVFYLFAAGVFIRRAGLILKQAVADNAHWHIGTQWL